MINLFKKNIHSFLGLASALHATAADYKLHLQCHRHPISSLAGCLGFVPATSGDVDRPPNVLKSVTLKPNPPPPSPSGKRDPGGIGFIDDVGGGVDGLMSCTECLGFESSDERRVDDQIEEIDNDDNESDNNNEEEEEEDDDDNDDGGELWRRRMRTAESRRNWRRVGNYHYNYEKKKVKKSFPPPLSSLNRNGQPSFFLRPVRKDGRLELTEVRIHRPEILHASRHDGRLTLHLVPDRSILDDIEEEEEEGELLREEEETTQQEEEEEEEELVQEEEEAEHLEEEIIEEEEEEMVEEIRYGKEERVGEWRFPNEGFRRCHEVVNQHHHVHGSHHHHHHHLRMCGVSIV